MLLLLLFMLIMPPVLVLPMILWNFHRGNDRMIYLLAFFMALWSMYYPPIGDQYRYFFIIKDFADLAEQMEWEKYNFVILLCYLAHLFKIPLEIVRAVCVFVSYSSVLAVAADIIRKKSRQNLRLPMLMTVFLSIHFWWICVGLRWMTACCLVIAGIYWFFIAGRKRLGAPLLIAGAATHFAIFFYAVLLFAFYFIMNIRIVQYRIVYLLLCGILFFTGEKLIFDTAFAIAADWESFNVYLGEDSFWNNRFWDEASFYYKIGSFLRRVPCYLYLIFLLIYWRKIRNKMQYFFLAGVLMSFFMYGYPNVTERLFLFLTPFTAVVFIFNLPQQIRAGGAVAAALGIMFFYTLVYNYEFRDYHDWSSGSRFWYLPGIMTCFQHYDWDYVRYNFVNEGDRRE